MDKKTIPFYKGKITLSKAIGHCSINNIIRAVKNPKKQIIDAIKTIRKTKDSVEKRRLKHGLYTFTVSCYVPYMEKRNYKNISYFTGFIQLDFDKVGGDLEELKIQLYKKPYIIAVFYSPSGNGLKAIGKITKPRNVKHYKAIQKAIKTDLNIDSFDDATKNPLLPMFISYDEEIYYKTEKDVVAFTGEDWSEQEFKLPTNLNETKYKPNNNNKEKTIRIYRTRINSIQESGHPQVLSAGLILGGRVAAGYIGYNEATSLIGECVRANDYLKKGTYGYLKTSIWALNNGYNNGAKYY